MYQTLVEMKEAASEAVLRNSWTPKEHPTQVRETFCRLKLPVEFVDVLELVVE
jgi:hypothetical protein